MDRSITAALVQVLCQEVVHRHGPGAPALLESSVKTDIGDLGWENGKKYQRHNFF